MVCRERRNQRSNSGEGGIGFFVKDIFDEVKLEKSSEKFEILWISCGLGVEKFYAVVYIKPSKSAGKHELLTNS